MAETRHSTTIELKLDTGQAKAALSGVEKQLEAVSATASGMMLGGPAGGGGAGTAAAPKGSPTAPAAGARGPVGGPSATTATSPGGGPHVPGGMVPGGGTAAMGGAPTPPTVRGGVYAGADRRPLDRGWMAWQENEDRLRGEAEKAAGRRRAVAIGAGLAGAGAAAATVRALDAQAMQMATASVAQDAGAATRQRVLEANRTANLVSDVIGSVPWVGGLLSASVKRFTGAAERERIGAVQSAQEDLIMGTAESGIGLARNLKLANVRNLAKLTFDATRRGFGVEEAAAMGASMRAASGGRGGYGGALAAANAQLSTGAVAGYLSTGAPGMGGAGGNPFAATSGLYGANADKMLGIIAAATTKMASTGLTVDLGATENLMGRLNRAHKGRYGAIGGGETGRAVGDLMGTISGARQSMFAPFAAFADASVTIEAMSRSGGSMMGLMEAFESMAREGPDAARRAINRNAGSLAPLVYAGQGRTSQMSRLLATLGEDEGNPEKPARTGTFWRKAAPFIGGAQGEALRNRNLKAKEAFETVPAGKVQRIGEDVRTRQRVMLDPVQEGLRVLKEMRDHMIHGSP